MEFTEVIPKSYPVELLQKDWSQRKCYFRQESAHLLEQVHELEVKRDDVWLITLPKCGTTWMQELLWLLLNDYDFETARKIDLELRTPFLEFNLLMNVDIENAFKLIENCKSPRLIKSHLPLQLLPKQLWQKKPKLIYVYHNPMDALISMYHQKHTGGHVQPSTLEQFIECYRNDIAYTVRPFEHVAEFYALRNEPWVFYTTFERMKQDLRAVIEALCQFLNKPINEEQVQQMLKHLSFEEMKKNPMVQHNWEFSFMSAEYKLANVENNFIREGKTNVYKQLLKPETIETLNDFIRREFGKHNVTLEEVLLMKKS